MSTPTVSKNYGFLGSIPRGVSLGTSTLGNYVSSLRHVFSSEGAKSIGGFGAIGNMFPENGVGMASGTSPHSSLLPSPS